MRSEHCTEITAWSLFYSSRKSFGKSPCFYSAVASTWSLGTCIIKDKHFIVLFTEIAKMLAVQLSKWIGLVKSKHAPLFHSMIFLSSLFISIPIACITVLFSCKATAFFLFYFTIFSHSQAFNSNCSLCIALLSLTSQYLPNFGPMCILRDEEFSLTHAYPKTHVQCFTDFKALSLTLMTMIIARMLWCW
jgi:hypothetical protein